MTREQELESALIEKDKTIRALQEQTNAIRNFIDHISAPGKPLRRPIIRSWLKMLKSAVTICLK
ncbi:MAG: hypothetical protein HQ517_13915 [SAR324 cluster bacterium]|nr:hypothetical protein [SAR324 cluster bacterium]